ncbi:NADH dehydrogenase [ubiquinone] flavoprotein 3, mitochondrial [Plecturocebus cupreus]
MVALLWLWQGRAWALKTILQEAHVFRGLASTVSLSAESGKSEKGQPQNPKKQCIPKNVVEPKQRDKLLVTQTAAELSKNLSSPGSHPPAVIKGGMVASPSPNGSVLFTDEGVLKFLSKKPLVEFPHKVLSPFRKQGSGSEARWVGQKVTSSSSSSLSSSSDSKSDNEADVSEVAPQVEALGMQGREGHLKAREAIVEDQTPPTGLETVPVEKNHGFHEKPAALKHEAKDKAMEDTAVPGDD